MKTFRFSLSTVREVRQSEEQATQKAYAEALRACAEVEVRRVIVDRGLLDLWQELRINSHQGIRADHRQHAHSWCGVLEEQQKQLASELAGCQRRVDAAHKSLQAATQRRETLDRMQRKQRRAHDREAQREDQKLLDECATRGAWRGTMRMEAA